MPATPGTITVVGLGPGHRAARTIETQTVLDTASTVILRTGIHPGVDELIADPRVSTCDDLYDRLDSFEAVYDAVVDRVIGAAQTGDVVYAVPGNPTFGERTVALLRDRARDAGISIELLAAVSALDEIAARLGIDPLADEVQLIDAARLAEMLDQEPFAAGRLHVDAHRPALIGQVYSSDLATAVKLALTHIYGDAHPVTVLTATGVPEEEDLQTIPLGTLDRHRVNHLTSVWVGPIAGLEAFRTESTVKQVVAHLRAPGGCPWDREQTIESMRDSLLDETYEVADAIDNGDLENLVEELGDVLFHVVFQSQIATESGDFTIEDVYESISRKLIRRHPHVFGTVQAETPADVIRTWNQIKSEEKAGKPQRTLYEKLPRSMPAMQRAIKLIGNDAPRDSNAPDSGTPGDQLLALIAGMIAEGFDPEKELSNALDAAYGRGATTEGMGGS
jgi:tetrapyrrole methylase family protein/MazG family protein